MCQNEDSPNIYISFWHILNHQCAPMVANGKCYIIGSQTRSMRIETLKCNFCKKTTALQLLVSKETTKRQPQQKK